MAYNVRKTELEGLLVIEPSVYSDERGFFVEKYRSSDFKAAGLPYDFVQIGHSFSKRDVLRGMHFQLRSAPMGKLVNVIEGGIFDVAIDVRKDSGTYKKWFGIELTGSNCLMLYIPEGFAHGFVVLEDRTHVIYAFTGEYSKPAERGINWNDPSIGIKWPVKNPILSEKDRVAPLLDESDNDW